MHLQTLLPSLIHALLWLGIVAVIFLPLEQVFTADRRKNGPRKLSVGDLSFYFINSLVPQFLLTLPLLATAYIAYHVVPVGLHRAIDAWPIWLRGLAAFVVADLGFYWGHRLMHEVPALWRFHAVHHAPQRLYFLVSARAHPIDNAIIRLCGLVPIYLLGLGAPQSVQGTLVATLLMIAITIWGFFIHADLRWRFGPLEWLVATPAFHRWHHSLDGPRDRNFASMLPCWDWLYGTLYLPRSVTPASYGIDKPLAPTVAGQLVDPLIPASAPDKSPAAGATKASVQA